MSDMYVKAAVNLDEVEAPEGLNVHPEMQALRAAQHRAEVSLRSTHATYMLGLILKLKRDGESVADMPNTRSRYNNGSILPVAAVYEDWDEYVASQHPKVLALMLAQNAAEQHLSAIHDMALIKLSLELRKQARAIVALATMSQA